MPWSRPRKPYSLGWRLSIEIKYPLPQKGSGEMPIPFFYKKIAVYTIAWIGLLQEFTQTCVSPVSSPMISNTQFSHHLDWVKYQDIEAKNKEFV